VKNGAEIAGARAAHRRDGAAVARYLAWLSREAPCGGVTEIDAVERLETLRAENRRAARRPRSRPFQARARTAP
jgi:Xaa-Pro aminopeptidase